MRIKQKIEILETLYSPSEIQELYQENKINLVGYKDAVEFIKKKLKTDYNSSKNYKWIYYNKELYFLNHGRKVYSSEIAFYIKDTYNNVALLCATRHDNGYIKFAQLNTNFLEEYKFMAII